ncbi:MAG: DUF3108 domain-containing protein, partial [Gemmatimonadales bacterium]
RLEYEAKFGLLRLGRASMEIMGIDTVRGDPTLHVSFLLEGGLAFYRLRDQMDSWIGTEDFTSRRFLQDFNEGSRHRVNDYEIFADSGFYRQAGSDTVFETSMHPLDDAAFFYFVRNVDLEPGRVYRFDNYFKPDRNPVILEVVGRDTLDLPAGRFATFEVKPIIKGNGIFREAANARLWITDDDRRLVVQIKSSFSFATITLRLEGTEGIPDPSIGD